MKKTMLKAFCIYFLSWLTIESAAQEKISLAGKWQVRLDPDSSYFNRKQVPDAFTQSIQLPGTTDEAHLGTKTTGSDYGILTRAYKYIGPAWYQYTISIPAAWEGKNITLFLERVLWESIVFMDGKEISTLSPLYVPHQHNLGKLTAGNHVLTICVNNDLIHNIGDKGHGYTEYTQSIWNGIVGRIELQAVNSLSIISIKTYPAPDRRSLKIAALTDNANKADLNFTLQASLKEIATNKVIKSLTKRYHLTSEENRIEILMNDLQGVKAWDEFDAHLYEIKLTLMDGENKIAFSDKLGFRNVSADRHKIILNDQAIYIRGNLDCVHFPLTGYPSCDIKDWENIFKKYKDYGLNTVRFHSWCPPEAAFEAADKMGIYIQAEIIWLDWWMAGEQKDRPEMNTKGYPQGLGKNPGADTFVQAEMKRVLDAYGNHPSFIFFCTGNELGNSDFDVMQKWIGKLKEEDPRRLYAVSTARKITPADDYSVTHNIPNIGGTYAYSMNKTDAGLEANYSRADIPIVAHEVGQVPVYPVWREIDKYTGVLKARNLQGFKATAEKNGIEKQDSSFHKATGHLQQLLYKNLVENITLAPSSAGFQLLSMQDYQGQGEALIGWLDCFWDDKGTTSPASFKGYSNAVVPLIRTQKFTYTRDDTMQLTMEVANYFKTAITKKLLWEIKDQNGNIIKQGVAKQASFPQGRLTRADSLTLVLSSFPDKAAQYTFRLFFADHSYSNNWGFFVFPSGEKVINTKGIYISNEWDIKVDSVLGKGGKVLLMAHELGLKATSANVNFMPLFWSASFFPGQGNETLGSMIEKKSEAFKYFPTDDFTNWQWYKITAGAKYFKLSGMPANFKPIVQPVSDFHYNEKLGSIFETWVGKGKLLVCGYNLVQPNNAYSRQLYYSLVSYMKSGAFNPSVALPVEQLKAILQKPQESVSVLPLPDEFKSASLYIKAGEKADSSKDWSADDDLVAANKPYRYSVKHASTVILPTGKAWAGKKFIVCIEPPKGVTGYVYVHLANPEGKKLSGAIIIEGREITTGSVPVEGKWIKLFMMREDTNDGKTDIDIISDNSNQLLIDQFVIMEEE